MTSEQIFQAQKIAMIRAFEASPNLGLTLAVNHEGLKITSVPQGLEWLGRYGHGQTGQLDVTVYEDGCSTPILAADVTAAVMAIANAAIPNGRVYDRIVIATNDEEFKRFYQEVGSPDDVCNLWLVRQGNVEELRGGGIDNEITGVVYTFEFFYWRRDLREYAGVVVLPGAADNPVPVRTVTFADSPVSLLSSDYTVLGDATDGDILILLPSLAAAGAVALGRIVNFKKIDSSANLVTVDGDAGELLDGELTQVLGARWARVQIQAGFGAWLVL